MDEQNRGIFPQNQENMPAEEQPAVAEMPAVEQSVAEMPAAETPAPEQPVAETPASEQPVAETSAPEQPAETYQQPPITQNPAFWQGGYRYQNPNPYQNYQAPYTVQPAKKKRNLPFLIAAMVAGGIMFVCGAVIFAVSLSNFSQFIEYSAQEDEYYDTPADLPQKEEEEVNNAPSARDENTIYNKPEIIAEKERGEALSLVEINKRVKDSVVGILVGDGKSEVVFSGSGFIVSEDGYIITNEHVVSGASQVKVVLSDGITEYQAVIVGKDSQSDLAILKVEAKGLAAAELGDSDALEVGEMVVAIGNPYGMVLAGSMTDGIISAMNRKIEINGSFMTLIQTNASINPGNSGGPLVNAYGQIVGICSSKLVATDYEGIGFAIPINNVIDIADELITYGYIKTRGYIGISGSDLAEEYCKYREIPQGVYISYVDPKCDAAKKGMKEGDIIVGFNGEEITSMARLNELKNNFRPGDVVTVKVWRNKEELTFKITLTESSD